MKKWEEYLLYPAITAALCSGMIAFVDWRRDTLESVWWYVISGLCMYVGFTVSSYLVGRSRRKKSKMNKFRKDH